MAGMATLTMKKSSTIMNVPAISTASAAQRLAASRANARPTVSAFSAVGAVLVSSASVTTSSFRETTARSSLPTGPGVVDYPVGKDRCTHSVERPPPRSAPCPLLDRARGTDAAGSLPRASLYRLGNGVPLCRDLDSRYGRRGAHGSVEWGARRRVVAVVAASPQSEPAGVRERRCRLVALPELHRDRPCTSEPRDGDASRRAARGTAPRSQ